ncbi:hypothetical protein PENSPDRAFT_320554 [Peniophora sp. CONT]|nr:hypothetical protein PENSPDRAFT_320554 [Peniophora sp. CONT]
MHHGLPPIHNIPTEILSHIFNSLRDSDDSAIGKPPPALLLRSVCRRWRVVAEGTPNLWPEVVGSYGLEWTRRALQWSKNCLLDLSIRRPDGQSRCTRDWSTSKSLLLAERHRIRNLSILFDGTADDPRLDVQVMLTLPLPRLEMLVMDGTDLTAVLLDEDTFSGEVPQRLKDLDLYACPILPTCPAFRAPLTSLKLYDCPVWTSMDALRDTLSGLPHLESFVWILLLALQDEMIEFTRPPLSASTDSNSRLVRLPKLQAVNMRVPVEVATFFFTRVVVPPSCWVMVDVDLDNVTPENVDDLYPAMDAAFGEHLRTAFADDDVGAGFRRVDIDAFQDGTVEGISISWTEPTTRLGPGPFHLGFLPLHDNDENVPPIVLALVCHMLDHWPAAHRVVSELHNGHSRLFAVDTGSTDPRSRAWARILRSLPRLELVNTENVDGFAEAFAFRGPDIVSPRLRRFNANDVDFTPANLARLMNGLRDYPSVSDEGTRSLPILHLQNCSLAGVKLPDFTAALDAQYVRR